MASAGQVGVNQQIRVQRESSEVFPFGHGQHFRHVIKATDQAPPQRNGIGSKGDVR